MTGPLPCPACGAPLAGAPSCAACGLRLLGPDAARLWVVDQQLSALREERIVLLGRLRSPEPVAEPGTPAARPHAAPVPAPSRDAKPLQVQNTLLGLGAALLAGAGIVFAAVTYRQLGVAGRAAVLLALTAAAAAAPRALLRRGLGASAEAVSVVAVVLLVLDAWALRRTGLDLDLRGETWWAGALLVAGAASLVYGEQLRLRAPQLLGVLLLQLPVPCVLARLDSSAAAAGAVLAVQGGAGLAAAHRWGVRRASGATAAVCAALVLVASLLATTGASADGDRAAWVGFVALAAVAAGSAALVPAAWWPVAVPVVPLLSAAAWVAAERGLTTAQQPLMLAACAPIGVHAAALVPAGRRRGVVAGALLVAAGAVAAELDAVVQAVVGPLSWVVDPWSRAPGPARDHLGVGLDRWDGTVVTLIVLAAAALTALGAGLVLDRLRDAVPPSAALLALAAVTLPLGLATSYRTALVVLLAVGGVAGVAGVALLPRARPAALGLVSLATASWGVAAAWSLAEEQPGLVVLPVCALLVAGIAVVLPGVLTAASGALGLGALAAWGAHEGLAAEQVGGLLLAAVVAGAGACVLVRGPHREALEVVTTLAAAAALPCAAQDPGWLSWVLGGSGLAALAVATRPDRRATGIAGGLLLSASSWVRLVDGGVTAPEPYAAPLALLAAVAGWYRHRTHPQARSWEVYGAATALALVPSLVAAWEDDTPTRGLLLLAAAVAVALLGAAQRLQAPLAIGSAVAALVALRLLAPYASAVPQWVLLGGAGLLLVGVGATYEARLRDLKALRDRFDAFG